MTPEKTIERLSLYRRLLGTLAADGVQAVYSHDLAGIAGSTAAQVRRDISFVGYSGSPSKGYDVKGLLASLSAMLDGKHSEKVALVGVGNLGRAVLAFFQGRRPKLIISAAFDADPSKTGRVIHGCRCHSMARIDEVVPSGGIRTAILAVPAVDAQAVADRLMDAGIRGLLNFAPVRLKARPKVFVSDIDMTMAIEKVAFFARDGQEADGAVQ